MFPHPNERAPRASTLKRLNSVSQTANCEEVTHPHNGPQDAAGPCPHELRGAAAKKTLDELVRRAKRGRVTLVYASRAGDISDATVLTRLLNRRARALMSRRHKPAKPARAFRASRKKVR